jgi:hypothetical protein
MRLPDHHLGPDWITTASGKAFHFRNSPDDAVDIEDIAHHLSLVNRFAGATVVPYSVAAHSLLVASILDHGGHAPLTVMHGLLHDASEAYLGDVSTPLKRLDDMTQYRVLEDYVQRRILDALGVPPLLDQNALRALREADEEALAAEAHVLLPKPQYSWGRYDNLRVTNTAVVHVGAMLDSSWLDHRANFTRTFNYLKAEMQG